MKIAYIISAYKYPDQLVRLVFKLNTNDTTFLIHFDERTDDRQYDEVVQGLKHLSNVILLDRHKCYWGDVGHVNATLKGIKVLFEKEIEFDYVVLLTGQDYPIKANDQIQDFFQTHEGKSFIEFFPLDFDSEPAEPISDSLISGPLISGPLWSARLERWHVVLFGQLRPILPNRYLPFPLKHRFPKGFKPFVGSSYWCLHKQCIEYIYNFIKYNQKFVDFFKFTLVSDEVFFQTILLNSDLGSDLVNDSLRFIKWTGKDWSGKPSILDSSNFEEMTLSSKLFARKFDCTRDKEIFDKLDQLTG